MKGKVKLVFGDESKCFPFEMAQGLLQIRKEMNRSMTIKKPGWELPDDSPYEFKDNGLIKRANTKKGKRASEPEGNTEGDRTPAEA